MNLAKIIVKGLRVLRERASGLFKTHITRFGLLSTRDRVQQSRNGEEVWAHSIPRPGGDACEPQDIVDNDLDGFHDLFDLDAGENSLVVKVFEGAGAWNFAVRLVDEDGVPFSEGDGITVSKFPVMEPGPSFIRGDANADGDVNLADGVFVLNYLFGGAVALHCKEASDANADGGSDIADVVYILNFLFTGGDEPPAPFPECGTVDGAVVDCGGFPACP